MEKSSIDDDVHNLFHGHIFQTNLAKLLGVVFSGIRFDPVGHKIVDINFISSKRISSNNVEDMTHRNRTDWCGLVLEDFSCVTIDEVVADTQQPSEGILLSHIKQ